MVIGEMHADHTVRHGHEFYNYTSSVFRSPAQKRVYHCFSFFFSRSASFIHKHGHNTGHRPFLSDLNVEGYARKAPVCLLPTGGIFLDMSLTMKTGQLKFVQYFQVF